MPATAPAWILVARERLAHQAALAPAPCFTRGQAICAFSRSQ